MAAKNEGLADQLVAVAGFAQRWLRGERPKPPECWRLEAMPGLFSTEPTTAGSSQPVERIVTEAGHVILRFEADASGVVPGVERSWQGPSELLATHLADPGIRLVFTLAPGRLRGVRGHWIAPATGPDGRRAMRRPGRHRPAAWQTVWGAPRWSAIVVSAEGYPELRSLQVGRAEGWLKEDATAAALVDALDKRGYDDPHRSVIAYQLVGDAAARRHTPALALRSLYLYYLGRGEGSRRSAVAEPSEDAGDDWIEPGEDGQPTKGTAPPVPVADLPSARGGHSERSLRREAKALAEADGFDGLWDLEPEEREGYRNAAVTKLAARQRLRDERRLLAEVLAEAGVVRSQRAIEQFVARHRAETPEELRRSVARYLDGRRR